VTTLEIRKSGPARPKISLKPRQFTDRASKSCRYPNRVGGTAFSSVILWVATLSEGKWGFRLAPYWSKIGAALPGEGWAKVTHIVHLFLFVAIPVFIFLEIGFGIVVGRALKYGRGEATETD